MQNIIEKTRLCSLLYIEDDADIRIHISELLNNLFKTVTVASNGEEALNLYHKAEFDIIITDIQMPKINGVSMIKQMQSLHPNQQFIIITAHDEAEYMELFKELHIDHVLHKPINFEAFVSTLKKVFL